MNPADEIITIVDEQNNVVETARRGDMRRNRLIHRACYVLVFNPLGELFVQHRTTTKDIYPGYYDVAPGGVVLAGESYEESARREIEEEMGIRGVTLTELFDFFWDDSLNRVWGRVYTCIYDGPMVLQPEEVESGAYYPLSHVFRMTEKYPFMPDGLYALRRYVFGEERHGTGG